MTFARGTTYSVTGEIKIMELWSIMEAARFLKTSFEHVWSMTQGDNPTLTLVPHGPNGMVKKVRRIEIEDLADRWAEADREKLKAQRDARKLARRNAKKAA